MIKTDNDRGKAATVRSGVQAFEERFREAGFRVLWEQKVPRVGMITAYSLGRTIVLIQDYDNGNGWNAFVPATDDGRIDVTLEAIAERAFRVTGITGADRMREICDL